VVETKAKECTLAGAFEDHLRDRQLKPRTVQDYRTVIGKHLADWADRPITEISRADVLARHAQLVGTAGAVQANLVMRTLRAVLAYSRAVYEKAPGVPLLDANPVVVLREAKRWAKTRPRTRYIAPGDLPAWWTAVQKLEPGMRDFLVVLLLTGRRKSELAGLRWEDVSLANRSMVFRDTKNATDVALPLGNYLHALLDARSKARKLRKGDKVLSPWVFPGRYGDAPLTQPHQALARVADMSGIQVSAHDLRRSFLTYADGLPGISTYILKALAGHKARDVTGEHYVQVPVDRLREPMQTVETFILTAAKVRQARAKAKRARLQVVRNA